MVNYQNGKIYAIKSNSGGKIYVGSTTKEYLSARMSEHRRMFKAWEKGNGNRCTSHELFSQYGVENCYIELIELFPCNTKDELATRENHYIRSLVCVNKNAAVKTRSNKEVWSDYYQNNKEEINRKAAKFRDDNRELVNRRVAESRARNIESVRKRDRICSAKRYAWKVISREFRAILKDDII